MQKVRSTPGGKGKGKATPGKKKGNKADEEEEGAEDSEDCPEDAAKSDESGDDSDREVSSATTFPPPFQPMSTCGNHGRRVVTNVCLYKGSGMGIVAFVNTFARFAFSAAQSLFLSAELRLGQPSC